MPADAAVPDPAPILDLLEAFRRSKTMFAALSLGVFDALNGLGFKRITFFDQFLDTFRIGIWNIRKLLKVARLTG